MTLASQFKTRFDLNGMYNAFMCGPFFKFISREISEVTSSLVSWLKTQKTRLDSLKTWLETRSSKFLRIENRVSRLEDQDARVCLLTSERYCTHIKLLFTTKHLQQGISACNMSFYGDLKKPWGWGIQSKLRLAIAQGKQNLRSTCTWQRGKLEFNCFFWALYYMYLLELSLSREIKTQKILVPGIDFRFVFRFGWTYSNLK